MPCPLVPTNPTVATYFEKGCVYWFDIRGNANPKVAIAKARPYMIIGRLNQKSQRVIICPVTDVNGYLEDDGSGKLKYPYHAKLLKSNYNFLEKDSAVLLDQVYTVSKTDFIREWYMGKVEDTASIDEAMLYNYDLFDAISQCVNNAIATIQPDYIKQYTRK